MDIPISWLADKLQSVLNTVYSETFQTEVESMVSDIPLDLNVDNHPYIQNIQAQAPEHNIENRIQPVDKDR